MSGLDLAALLCSRLCHDLVSPVGAISNGLEILSDDNDAGMREQVLDLIGKSAEQTANKLQFFRLAFGAAGGFSEELDFAEARRAVEAFLNGSRVELSWSIQEKSAAKTIIKILLNMVLLASESLIRGGELSVQKGEGQNYLVKASGARVIVQDSVLKALNGEVSEDALEPRTAPAMLVSQASSDFGGKVNVDQIDAENFALRLSLDFQ